MKKDTTVKVLSWEEKCLKVSTHSAKILVKCCHSLVEALESHFSFEELIHSNPLPFLSLKQHLGDRSCVIVTIKFLLAFIKLNGDGEKAMKTGFT